MREIYFKILQYVKKWTTVIHKLLHRLRLNVNRMYKILRWIISSINIIGDKCHDAKRLLMVYDLSSQPFSIGDILVFQEASLVLRHENSVDLVDFAIVYNPIKPTCDDSAFSNITEENYLYNLASILPVAQVNQHLGSMFLFNSHSQLETFLADNVNRYCIWPAVWKYVTKEYLYYTIFNEIILYHFVKYKSIPQLNSRAVMLYWASNFLQKYVFPLIPVTVQLRKNNINPIRNSNYESWLDFFKYCNERYPVKFIVICSESEIDERFMNLQNVLLAKKYHTDIEQDLALINCSAIHMGASSGPGTIALFSSKPFIMINATVESMKNSGFKVDGNIISGYFLNTLQRFIIGDENTEIIIKEFDRIWRRIDLPAWKNNIKKYDIDREYSDQTWLR